MLLILPTTIIFVGQDGQTFLVRAQDDADGAAEDTVEGEEGDDATIETDETTTGSDPLGTDAATTDDKGEEEEEGEAPLKPSPNAETHILFTRPVSTVDLPAGGLVKFLVGFTNKGDKDFIVETMDASFRYPQDYSFYIQNFTTLRFDKTVEPSRQATFEYTLTPSETFNARPFGLTVNLNYKDNEGNIFQDAVFNETVNIVEPDEGLDGETFFMYVFLAAISVLLLVGAQQLLASFGKKRLSKPKQPKVEMGTSNDSDINYEWVPKESLIYKNKSPKSSPRDRRKKRTTGDE